MQAAPSSAYSPSADALNPKARLYGLDSLRALAIILVLLYHYMVVVSHENTFGWLTRIGWTGVDLFFVLSGYLIGNQIFSAMAKGEDFSLKLFYQRRLLRTLPNYYLVLGCYLLFPAALSGVTTAPLWQFLIFGQNLTMFPMETFTHSWSLCIEEQFYVIFPAGVLLLARINKSPTLIWLALAIAMLGAMAARAYFLLHYGGSQISGRDYYGYIYYPSFTRFDELLPGVALALFKNFHPQAFERLLRHGQALLLAGIAAVAVMFYVFMNLHYSRESGTSLWVTTFGYSLLALSFALLTLAALAPNSWLSRWRVPGACSLALWSYAIYLAHKPLFLVLQKPLASLDISVHSGLGIGLIMAISTLGGWLLYRLVETPFMRLRAKHFPSNIKSPARATNAPDALST